MRGGMWSIFKNISLFVNKSPFKEYNKLQKIDEEKFPDILRRFVKQKYNILLEIKDDNIKKGSRVYEAKEILEGMEILDSFDPNTEVEVQINDLSEMKVRIFSILK